jgi:transcriptional regulator with XRE-family HTH domain
MAHKLWRKRRHTKWMQLTQSQIGRFLQALREELAVSQRKAAEFLDTDAGTISRWETGKQPMSAEALIALVRFYGAEALFVKWVAEWDSLYGKQAAGRPLARVAEPAPLYPAAPSAKQAAASKGGELG